MELMKSYVALLRGIMPQNPNMRNDKLRGVFEGLGFSNVRSVIGSGNILFETDASDTQQLESAIEQALTARLGITSTTIIRSQDELLRLVKHDPFKDISQPDAHYLTVTFCKTRPQPSFSFPHQPANKNYTLINLYDREICCVSAREGARTTNLMTWLEKQFGKEITTRTYKTVGKIIDKLATP
jgi:uncharacterized protein (DUF1697 family)